jgi:hypothetical protein
LEDDIASVAHDLRADLDQLLLQACQRCRNRAIVPAIGRSLEVVLRK